jgi:hypothetical protein
MSEPAIAIGLVGMMFFLLDFGSRLNLQTSGKGIIDINDIAKTTFTILSFVVGIGLALFMYGSATKNIGVIENVTLVGINFWIFLTCFLLLFFLIYYLVVIPRLFQMQRLDK